MFLGIGSWVITIMHGITGFSYFLELVYWKMEIYKHIYDVLRIIKNQEILKLQSSYVLWAEISCPTGRNRHLFGLLDSLVGYLPSQSALTEKLWNIRLAVVKHSVLILVICNRMEITPVEEIFVRRSLISCFGLMNHEIMTLTQVKK